MTYHQARYEESLIFLQGGPGRVGVSLPEWKAEPDLVPAKMARKELKLPELSEPEVVRHYTKLTQMNFGVDSGSYYLGSCTMKYNPRLNEWAASHPAVVHTHPLQDPSTAQGSLQLMHELQGMLCEVAGMDAVSLQPSAGAHGEFTGLMVAKAYHESRNDPRTDVILPNTAHGTNPASAAMAGFNCIEIPSLEDGTVDLDALGSALSKKTAVFMLTNPNTLGIFEHNVLEIARLCHEAGALLYYDGANLNAIMGKTRPGDMGYDIVHFNLHKTFSTPHGGGGPGSGPVGVKKHLAPFLPAPIVEKKGDQYVLDYARPQSIGKVGGFYGNFGVMVRAWTYIKVMGGNGLKEASEMAVLNANYMKERLLPYYDMPHKKLRKHEFVLSGKRLKEKGCSTKDVAKRLLDRGMHAPTIYFPLIVDEAIMIEPCENEPREELDRYVDALIEISKEPADVLHGAPTNTKIGRPDEIKAARDMVLCWRASGQCQTK